MEEFEIERKKMLKGAIFNYRLYCFLIPLFIIVILLIYDYLCDYFPSLVILYKLPYDEYGYGNLLDKIGALIAIPCFALIFIFSQLYYYNFKEKKLNFSYIIKEKIISEFFKEYVYTPQKGLGSDFINETEIYAYNIFITHDLIKGLYKGSEFEFCIVETYEEKHYSSSKIGKIIELAKQVEYEFFKFEGVILGFDIGKKFKSKTIIVDKSYNTKINGKREILDNSEFNENFRIFSDDEIETRYLLDFLSMEKIIKFQNEIGDGNASFAFIDGKFYLFLNGYHFDYNPSLFNKINETDIKIFVDQIKNVISFIDFFIDNNSKSKI